MSNENVWIHQVNNYGLGNFINCTPAIQKLSERFGHPVNVYFDLPFVRDCFLDCPFINILEKKPIDPPLFTSRLSNKATNDKADFKFIYETIINEKWDGQRCYVDQPTVNHRVANYVVLIHGSGNESQAYLDSKCIDEQLYIDALNEAGIKWLAPVFVGNQNDLFRNEWAKPYSEGIGDIRATLALINGASLVIGNDTGLIHAAGAMGKRTIVFWKDTQLPRNMNSGVDCTYLMKSEWDKVKDLI